MHIFFLHICMYVYTRIYVYICKYTHMYVYMSIYVHMYMYIHVYIHVHQNTKVPNNRTTGKQRSTNIGISKINININITQKKILILAKSSHDRMHALPNLI